MESRPLIQSLLPRIVGLPIFNSGSIEHEMFVAMGDRHQSLENNEEQWRTCKSVDPGRMHHRCKLNSPILFGTCPGPWTASTCPWSCLISKSHQVRKTQKAGTKNGRSASTANMLKQFKVCRASVCACYFRMFLASTASEAGETSPTLDQASILRLCLLQCYIMLHRMFMQYMCGAVQFKHFL